MALSRPTAIRAERRLHPRLPVEAPARYGSEELDRTGTVADLSLGGACIVGPRPAADEFVLEMDLDGNPLGVSARVVRTVPADGGDRLGIEFRDLDGETRETLKGFLKREGRRRLGRN